MRITGKLGGLLGVVLSATSIASAATEGDIEGVMLEATPAGLLRDVGNYVNDEVVSVLQRAVSKGPGTASGYDKAGQDLSKPEGY